MNAEWKSLYDLPEHALEQIVGVLSKHSTDLNTFYNFGLSSKLFHKPTVRTLDKENIFFPMDIGKNESNKKLMQYISKYDEETKAKFGLKIVARKAKDLEEKVYEWTKECVGLRKLFFDKVEFRIPACFLNAKQILCQNIPTIEVLKVQNTISDPEALCKIEGWVAACKNLKDFEVMWNLKYFEDEPARAFKYSLFDIFDNTPSIETFRIQVPDKVTNRHSGKECDGPRHGLIFFDLRFRFFYEKVGFSTLRQQNILPKTDKKSQIRKSFVLNGQVEERSNTD